MLAIENHDRFNACQLAEIVQDTDPQWVGICLDTANSLGAGEGIGEAMRHLAPYTVNLHIKDVVIKRVPSNMGFTVAGCPAGEGVIDIPRLLSTLSKNRNFFSVTLELWPEFSVDLEQTINKEHTWVRQSLTYLRKVMDHYLNLK
jgi:sugar phosphate isomerase/epimerase